MQKLRQVISDIEGDLKGLNLDDRQSKRYLISKFTDKIQNFLRQDARSREILKDNSVWKPINCIPLQDVSVNGCGCEDGCDTLKRTEIQIPEAYNTNYGLLIKVLLIDGSKEFRGIKSNEYKDYITRQYGKNLLVYWIEDKYIYIPNVNIDNIKVLILAKDTLAVDKLNKTASVCTSPLDAEVNYPDYLITLAKKEVVMELGASKGIVEDEKGDNNTNRKQ